MPNKKTAAKLATSRTANTATDTAVTSEQLEPVVKEIKKKRERPDRTVNISKADNSMSIRHTLHMWDWEQPDMTDNDAVKERIAAYFALCDDDNIKPSVEGLAVAFCTNRQTLWRWCNGAESKYIPQIVRDTLKRAYSVLNAQMVNYMQNGQINPVAGIFLMKNNMAYTDQTEVVLTPNAALGQNTAPADIAAKYEALPEGDE